MDISPQLDPRIGDACLAQYIQHSILSSRVVDTNEYLFEADQLSTQFLTRPESNGP